MTSSYFEGECNELSAFGYNRDGKKGKRQIVIGLLCNERGEPLSIEVFRGNTQDPQTVASQIRKVASRFGAEAVTFVGDRGMIKSPQISDLAEEGFHYITAITNAQVKTLLKDGVIQMGLFDHDLAEVKTDAGVRYILRRNPIREKEVRNSREDRFQALARLCEKQEEYLQAHSRASVEVALRKVNERAKSFKLAGWVSVATEGREIRLCRDEDALQEMAKLDGCYVLKTDVEKSVASKETVHSRYKDLSQVEWAFRTSKTTALELRPIHVRLASRTRGHVFVVMLAYRIMQELARRWRGFDLTVSEGISQLGQLCATELLIEGQGSCQKIPQPRELLGELLEAAEVVLPEVLPRSGIRVATRRSLKKSRAKR